MLRLVLVVVTAMVLLAIHLKDPFLGPDDELISSIACQYCLHECMGTKSE